MDLSRFKINNFVTIICIGSDSIKNKLYSSLMSMSKSKHISNLDVHLIKCPNNMTINMWNVKQGITNQNRYFISDIDTVLIIHDLEKNYEYFEKSLVQKNLLAKNSGTIVVGVYQNDNNAKTRKNIVTLGKFCLNNDIECKIISEPDIGEIMMILLRITNDIRLTRKKVINQKYKEEFKQ